MRELRLSDKARNFILFFCVGIVSIILVEIGLRYFAPPLETVAGTQKTPKAVLYGWALPPDTEMEFVDPDTGDTARYVTNSQGWKDDEHQFATPEGVFRILFVGDSITAGRVHPNDLYTNKVRQLLLERGLSNVEIISLGVGGWGTDQILEVIKLEGLKYDPDIIIYQFNPNDLTDNLTPGTTTPRDNIRWKKPFKYELQNGKLTKILIDPPEQSNRTGQFLMRSAIVYNVVRAAGMVRNALEDSSHVQETGPRWWEQFPIHPTTPIRYYKGEQTPEMEEAWSLFEALILEMKTTVEAGGAKFVIFSTAGDDGYRQWNLDHKWMFADAEGDYIIWEGERYPVEWNKLLESLEQLTELHNISLIKPTRAYERFYNDAHPNARGNLSMAQDIVDYLMEQGDILAN